MQRPRFALRVRRLAPVLAATAFVGVPGLAAAETDFATIGKVYCVPDTVTRCSEAGKCTTRAASAEDKAKVMQIDFAGKSLLIRGGGDVWNWIGAITEDTLEKGVRRIVMTWGSDDDRRTMRMTLTKGGKLSIDYGGAGGAEATCTAAAS
jgi:hypothetical protein